MIAVLKHELSNYYHSLTAYIFSAFLLVFVGLGAMLYNIQSAMANFEYVLSFVCIGFVLIVPILTMKVLAEERKQKTDQLLFSLPLTTSQIVVGKFLALLVVYLVPLVIIAFYPLIFSKYGDVYLPTSYGSLFAFFMLGAALIAIGVFISSLTENIGLAAGITVPVILLNYYSVTLSEYVSSTAVSSMISMLVLVFILSLIVKYLTADSRIAIGLGLVLAFVIIGVFVGDSSILEGVLPNIMTKLSLFDRFSKFVNGVFDLTGIVYYVTVIIFFLFLSVQSLEKRRYN